MNEFTAPQIIAKTRQIYDEHIAEYETSTSRFDLFPGLDVELDRFFDRLPGITVLDLGCGVGRDTEHLTGRGAEVVAGDLSLRMLQRAHARCSRFTGVQLNLLELPFAVDSFDGVWACASILHVPREYHEQAFHEIYRVLARGGIAAISLKRGEGEGWMNGGRLSFPRWFSMRTPDAAAREMAGVGFASIQTLPSGRGDWFVIEATKA
jgi:SAM-dependent methyltransferase